MLWTRLAPRPLDPDGGMRPHPVPVRWQVAEDDGFRRVVCGGTAVADADHAHAVHVAVRGLRPDRWYYYRFRHGDALSPVGRTRTLPAPGSAKSRLRVALVSCQRFEDGYYTAYRDMADRQLDLVVHLGDYIYENVFTTGPRLDQIPTELRGVATDLTGYRLRHALYRLDPDLQAAHASFPWLLIPDNHDAVEDGDHSPARAAAYQAYYEHLPLPAASRPVGARMRIHHTLDFGSLFRLNLLDTRQHRDDQQVCGTGIIGAGCAPLNDPHRTMLGVEQERWLRRSLATSDTRWNAIGQTVLFAPYDFTTGPERGIYYASWDGYPAARQRLLEDIATARPANPVMLSADWHTAWVNNVPADPGRLDGAPVLTELLTSGVSSNPTFTGDLTTPSMKENPQVRFYDQHCGYTLCTVSPAAWRTDFIATDTSTSHGDARRISSWTIENGRAEAHPS